MRRGILSVCLIGLGVMMACAPKNWVVLVPDPEGTVGKVTVSNAAGTIEIRSANHFTAIADRQSAPSAPIAMDPARLKTEFGQVLAIEPQRPVHFLLHFETGSTRLLPESDPTLPEVVRAIRDRASRHVSIVGHTDTQGDQTQNVTLSLERAQAIKEMLAQAGIDAATMEVTSHGEANPIVQTADDVANAQNRRVEVVVR